MTICVTTEEGIWRKCSRLKVQYGRNRPGSRYQAKWSRVASTAGIWEVIIRVQIYVIELGVALQVVVEG